MTVYSFDLDLVTLMLKPDLDGVKMYLHNLAITVQKVLPEQTDRQTDRPE